MNKATYDLIFGVFCYLIYFPIFVFGRLNNDLGSVIIRFFQRTELEIGNTTGVKMIASWANETLCELKQQQTYSA